MNSVVMIFAGEYDIACRDQLRETLDSLSDEPQVILDFSRVTYVDSTVVNELVRLHNRRASKGFARETLVLQSKSLYKLFDMLGMRQVFLLVRALDDVIGRVGESAAVVYAFNGGETSSRLSLDKTG